MDHYTVLRCHVTALEKWLRDHPGAPASVDSGEFSIAPLLAEAFKRVDPHRYVLLASDGCVHLLASSNAPVPAEFRHKRYMKSNPRSNIKDVVKVLYNLLGVTVESGAMDLASFIKLLHFFVSFQIENEEMVNLNVCSEWFHYIRRQFFCGPAFLPHESVEAWKRKYRDPAVRGLYDSVAKQEQIDTLSSFVDKQATILFSMKSGPLEQQLEAIHASARDMKALMEERAAELAAELAALKKLVARHDEEMNEYAGHVAEIERKLGLLHEKAAAEAAAPSGSAPEAVAEEKVEVAVEAVVEAVAEEKVEVAVEAVVEAVAEVAEAVAEEKVEVAVEAVAESVAEEKVEVAVEAVTESVAEEKPEAVAEEKVEVAAEAVVEAVAEVAEAVAEEKPEADVEAVAEAVAEEKVEVAVEAVAESVAEEKVEVAVEAVAEAVAEEKPEADVEAVAEAVAEEKVEVAVEAVAEAVAEEKVEVAVEAVAEAVAESVAEEKVEVAAEDVSEEKPAAVAEAVSEDKVDAAEFDEPAPEIVEPEASVAEESGEESGEDDIELVRVGTHFVIKGTNVVVSIQDGSAIGYLDAARVLHKEESEEVKKACETYGLLFS